MEKDYDHLDDDIRDNLVERITDAYYEKNLAEDEHQKIIIGKKAGYIFNNEHKICYGYLFMKVNNRFLSCFGNNERWVKRYCIVAKNKFKYYKDEEMTKIDGVLDFDLLTCYIKIEMHPISKEPIGFKYDLILIINNIY